MNFDNYLGKSKQELDTPCLVIDKLLLEYNLKKMQAYANSLGKQLRPHAKVHKCSALCKEQIKQGCIGISVSKVSEAEILTQHNILGILITSPVVTKFKIERLMSCLRRTSDIIVVIDNKQNADQLNTAAEAMNAPLNVLVDVDPGFKRTGIPYDKALELAEHIDSLPFLNLKGIQCYAANLQHIADYQERKTLCLDIMDKAAGLIKDFQAKGLCTDIFTGGGTGTYDIDTLIDDVTEIQPGSYAVMDQEYATIGSNEHAESFEDFKPAMTLLTTVISANHRTHVTVDAGSKSLYIHPTSPKIIYPRGLTYDWADFGDEHGRIDAKSIQYLPSVGEVVEMIVPHCDPTINLFDYFFITENEKVVDIWPIDMRGKSQ